MSGRCYDDLAGNLDEVISAKGECTRYTYTDAGLLARIENYADSSTNTPSRTVSYSF